MWRQVNNESCQVLVHIVMYRPMGQTINLLNAVAVIDYERIGPHDSGPTVKTDLW